MFKNLGPMELLIIVVIIMIMFGGKKIPELMHGLGKGINEFKRASAPDDPAAKEAAAAAATPTTPKV